LGCVRENALRTATALKWSVKQSSNGGVLASNWCTRVFEPRKHKDFPSLKLYFLRRI